jgi:hypothetical protein
VNTLEEGRPFNEVRLHYRDGDRSYIVRFSDGHGTQEIRDGSFTRQISVQGNLPNMTYAPEDLRAFQRAAHGRCVVAGLENTLRITCAGGVDYPETVLTIDVVGQEDGRPGRVVIAGRQQLDADGRVRKTEERSLWTPVGDKLRPRRAVLTDHGRNPDVGATADDFSTTVEMENWRTESADEFLH